MGLATCTVAWSTTEDLLADTVGNGSPGGVGLAGPPAVVARGPRGLILHDLARDVLTAELERRSPERFRRLHGIIHDRVVADHPRRAAGRTANTRRSSCCSCTGTALLTSAIETLRSRGSAAVLPGLPEDRRQVVAIVDRFLGAQNAEMARRWLTTAPFVVQTRSSRRAR